MVLERAEAPHSPGRLQQRADFVRVQSRGRRFRRPHLVLLVDRDGLPSKNARVGYTVSRKVGNAVVRNRVRRRLRAIVRARPELLVPPYDYVIIAVPAAAGAEFATLQSEVTELLAQAAGFVQQTIARAASEQPKPVRS